MPDNTRRTEISEKEDRARRVEEYSEKLRKLERVADENDPIYSSGLTVRSLPESKRSTTDTSETTKEEPLKPSEEEENIFDFAESHALEELKKALPAAQRARRREALKNKK